MVENAARAVNRPGFRRFAWLVRLVAMTLSWACACTCVGSGCGGSQAKRPWAGPLDVAVVEPGSREDRDLASIRRMSPDGQAREIKERSERGPTKQEQALILQLVLDALEENRLLPFLQLVGAMYIEKLAAQLEDPDDATVLGVAIYSAYARAGVPEGKRLDLEVYVKALDSAGRAPVVAKFETNKAAWLDRQAGR